MKRYSWYFIAIFLLFAPWPGCRKPDGISPSGRPTIDQLLIAAARQAFTRDISQIPEPASLLAGQNQRKQSEKTPSWGQAYTMEFFLGKAVVVPLNYERKIWLKSNLDPARLYYLDNIARLLIYKGKDQEWHEEIISSFPDSNWLAGDKKSYSGIVTVEDWMGNLLNEYKYEKGIVRKFIAPENLKQAQSTEAVNGTPAGATKPDLFLQVCYTVQEYNYAVDDPSNGIYTTTTLGCDTYFFADIGSVGGAPSGSNYGAVAGGGGGGAGISPASNFKILNGNNIIANIQVYNECFTNIGGNNNSFQVTVCVDQPNPGSRVPWNFSNANNSSSSGNPVDVGHSFLIMKQSTPNGTVTRNVGFYPKTRVVPTSPSDQGQLNDDEVHYYNISLTINVTNSQFFNILNFINQGNNTGYQYNLNSNNCTTFVLHALYAGGIYLPWTTGNWPLGSGNDPGDLGEDIRTMSLSSNMSRNLFESYHPNQGSCLPAP
jgi:hypothetical protein